MPYFDVTVARTGCVMVEADNGYEAMKIASYLPSKNISWTDNWEATDATQIASNAENLGDDATLAMKDPFIKARILAEENNWSQYMASNGCLCLISYNKDRLPFMLEALKRIGYHVESANIKMVDLNTWVCNGKLYTPAALSGRLGLHACVLTARSSMEVVLVSPVNKGM